MNVFQRIRCIVRGKTEVLLDRLENPDEQLAVFVNQLDEQMRSLQQAVARALADEKRLRMDIEDHLVEASEWEKRAELALEAGDEELAQQALGQKEDHETRSLVLQRAWQSQKAATERLKVSLRQTKERAAEAKRKYTLLLAQYKSAETTKQMHESLSSCADRSPMQLMEKLSDKIRQIEAETEAALELGGDSADAQLEARFAELERAKRGCDALQQLKAKVASQQPAPEH